MKLIALDIDNTLLNTKHQITPLTKRALQQAATNGLKIVLATGKTRASSGAIKEALNLQTPGVYLQGLVITAADGTPTKKIELPTDVTREALETAVALGYPFTAYHDTHVYALERSPYTEWVVDYQEPAPQVFDNLEQLLAQQPVQKIIFRHEPEVLQKLRPIFAKQFSGRASLVNSQTWLLEIVPLGTSKGGGLRIVLDEMNIAPEDIIAFGDGENDLEMLQMAGVGVAMGNAMPILKDTADFITRTNDEDGIAYALKHLGLIE